LLISKSLVNRYFSFPNHTVSPVRNGVRAERSTPPTLVIWIDGMEIC